MEDLTIHTVPSRVATTLFNIKLNQVAASFTPSLVDVVYDGETFIPGFNLNVQGFNLYDILRGSANLIPIVMYLDL